MICQYCKKHEADEKLHVFIPSYNITKYFCCNDCKEHFIKRYKVGIPRKEETKKRISNSNSKPHTDSRKKSISIARRKKLDIPEDRKEEIIELLKKPYYSLRLISEITGFREWRIKELSKCVKELNFSNEIRVINKQHKNKLFNDKEKLDWLQQNAHRFTRKELTNYLGDMIPFNPWLKKYMNTHTLPAKILFHKGPTKPELKFKEYMDANNIIYESNKMVSGINLDLSETWYSVDFVICDKVFIEIQGDFWHANPKIYKINELCGIQRNNVNRDRRKKAQLLTKYDNMHYFQIWENDIMNNTQKFQEQLKQILCIAQNMK